MRSNKIETSAGGDKEGGSREGKIKSPPLPHLRVQEEGGGGGVVEAAGLLVDEHGHVEDAPMRLGLWRRTRGTEGGGWRGLHADGGARGFELEEGLSAERTGVAGLRGGRLTLAHFLMQRRQKRCGQPSRVHCVRQLLRLQSFPDICCTEAAVFSLCRCSSIQYNTIIYSI